MKVRTACQEVVRPIIRKATDVEELEERKNKKNLPMKYSIHVVMVPVVCHVIRWLQPR